MTTKDIFKFGEEIGVHPYPGDRDTSVERHKARIFKTIVDLGLSGHVATNALEALQDAADWQHEDVVRVFRAYGRSLEK